jgi:hypothetical protein
MLETVGGNEVPPKNMMVVASSSFEHRKDYTNNEIFMDNTSKKPEKSCFVKSLNTMMTLLAVVIAIGGGIALRVYLPDKKWTERELMYLGFPGEVFLR